MNMSDLPSGLPDKDYENIPDGQYDSEFEGKPTVETVETKICDDGVEETHITHDVKQPLRWTFSSGGNKRFAKNYDEIDWSK